jgi:hypothetical protein
MNEYNMTSTYRPGVPPPKRAVPVYSHRKSQTQKLEEVCKKAIDLQEQVDALKATVTALSKENVYLKVATRAAKEKDAVHEKRIKALEASVSESNKS